MKVAAGALAICAVLALAWIAGELHRSNCYARHATCSMLPWAGGSGTPPKLEVVTYQPTDGQAFQQFEDGGP